MSKVINISRKSKESIILTLPDGDTITMITTRRGTQKTIVTLIVPEYVNVRRSELERIEPAKG